MKRFEIKKFDVREKAFLVGVMLAVTVTLLILASCHKEKRASVLPKGSYSLEMHPLPMRVAP